MNSQSLVVTHLNGRRWGSLKVKCVGGEGLVEERLKRREG